MDNEELKGLNGIFESINNECFDSCIKPYKLKFSKYSARTHGRINFRKKEIMISHQMFMQYGWDAVWQTMLHEMCHAYIHQEGGQARHSKRFWNEFEKRGGIREKIYVKPKAAYVYACPTCGVEIERMKKIKKPYLYSCIKCDKNYNMRHRLYLKRDKGQVKL